MKFKYSDVLIIYVICKAQIPPVQNFLTWMEVASTLVAVSNPK